MRIIAVSNVLFSSDKKDWETPQSLFDQLNAEFHFTLDAAASDQNHKLPKYYTAETDGLTQDWGGERVFCNPPYGNAEIGQWTEKCYQEAQKPNTLVVLLIPARTDRISFHEYIYQKPGVEIRFLRGRLKFEDHGKPIGTAPFPSMLCIFNNSLRKAGENMENTLSINWGSGHADVYADQFFPCTLETFKKLMKLIALDYEHRQDHSEWLRRYFIGRVDRAKVDLPVWVKAYSNAKQQVADFKRVLETRKWPNGIYVTNTEVVQESLAEYRAKRNAAETEIKRCQKDIKSLTRCLEILEEGG